MIFLLQVMTNLKVLNLTGCHLLEKTPTFTASVNIERLILRDCKSLVEIDSSICCLKRLVYLDASSCTNLCKLPDDLGKHLASLMHLQLGTLYMDTFPDLSNLSNLKELDLTFRPPDFDEMSNGLGECSMPRWIGNLSKLESLVLRSDYVTTSPAGLSLPPQLKSLRLECSNLRCLPRLPSSISSMQLYDCKSLCSAMDLTNFKNLSSLQISRAAITKLQGLGCLKNLRDLQLNWLGQVKMLPDLSKLNKLGHLRVRSCDNLVEIQGELPLSLDKVRISSCRSLWKLPDLSSLMGKTDVEIDYCDRVLEHVGMNRQDLELVGLKQLQVLPDLSNSNELRRLRVENCSNLGEIQGELPQSLEELEISSCESLKELPDLSRLKKLQKVDIEGCTKLEMKAILGSARRSQASLWENLGHLRICGLGQVEILPDPSNFNKLRRLHVEDCGNLIEIQGKLPQSLEELEIDSCKSLRKLPDLLSLNGLQKVKIHRCYNLDVEALSRLCSEKSIIFVDED
ncbi:protein SUPPRESSOR OF npr1-1, CONSTITUTIVE 1-like [Rhodamnia argentea]|uniref:Protein SUPPRESSOR OF npr1-1, CONSTITUTIVE 1-like n=1 Tax=Rhodamnia argentea TaxID=178133 RepID=A0ABM3H3N8_9MYRT|nr:protein SUPPRESSOR OF npr1-1, CONSTITUTIVE 1-like [Rhodamnia argentea]